jgi:hypothetical protein
MNRPYIRWILAIIITLSAAVYQRLTGPTHPLKGSETINGKEISYQFNRSHGGSSDQPVRLAFTDTTYKIQLVHKRYKVEEDWIKQKMNLSGDSVIAALPGQPPAGKLEYYLELQKEDTVWKIPSDRSIVTRFKGVVPAIFLTPHILLMFLAMLISNLVLLEAFAKTDKILTYTVITTTLLFLGGMILGPIVQKYAFGAYWTGVPFGWDLTDNKTLLAMIAWLTALAAMIKNRKKELSRYLVITASIVMLAIYLIPHSTMGSEFDYSKNQVVTGDLE